MLFSSQEREQIYRETKWVRGNDLAWRFERGAHRLEAVVVRANGEALRLIGIKRRAYSFSLLYRNSLLIRRWDTHGHTNPDGEKMLGGHKHRWTDEHGENLAYRATDVPTDDVHGALMAFLAECNIQVEGVYSAQATLVLE